MKNWIRNLLVAATLLPVTMWAGTLTGTVTNSAGGAAIDSALVVVRLGGAGTPILDSTRTSATGVYTITGVAAGTTYRITTSATGFTTATVTPVTVTAAGTTTTNFALVAPVTSGSITGTVTAATGGAAISGALVVVRLTAAGAILDSTRTSATGTYTLTGLAVAATYRVTASATGYTTLTNTPVAVTAGGTTTSNFALATAPAPGTLTGTVTNAAGGAPIANVLITVQQGAAGGAILDSTRTSATGTYSITGLAAAVNYRVTATVAGFTAATVTPDTITSGGTRTTNFALVAVAPGTLTGTVTAAVGGAAIANALVTVQQGGAGTPILDSVRTSATGTYTISGLAPAANYRVTASAIGYTNATVTPDTITNGGTRTTNFALAAIAHTITGQVVAGGVAVAGATVTLTGGATTTTNATGVYTFNNVAVGTQTVTVTAAGFAAGTGTVTITATTTTAIVNITLSSSALYQVASNSRGIRFSSIGSQLALDLGVSNVARTVTVYSLNGVLRNQTSVPAGVSRAVLPAAFAPANGFLFQVK